MIERIANHILLMMRKHGIIKYDEELYRYGLELEISYFIGTVFLLAIALITNTLLLALIYMFLSETMKKYNGGFHADTYWKCNLTFLSIFIFSIIIDFYFIDNVLIEMIIYIIQLLIIIFYAPVDHENHPLDKEEKRKYKKKSIIINVFAIILSIFIYFLDFKGLQNYILIVLFLNAISVLVGEVKRNEKNCNN